MSTKALIGAIIGALLVGFACGKYTKDDKVVETTKTTTTDTKKDTTSTDTKVNKDKVITITERKDGTKVTVITDKSTIDTTKLDKSTETSKTQNETYKEVLNNTNKVNLSVMSGINITSPSNGIIYGGAITKQVLGPFSIGIWGLSNGTAGASVGISL